jgi:hypothetical protein
MAGCWDFGLFVWLSQSKSSWSENEYFMYLWVEENYIDFPSFFYAPENKEVQ